MAHFTIARPVREFPRGVEFTAPGFSPGHDTTILMRTDAGLVGFDPTSGKRIAEWSAPGWDTYMVPAGWSYVYSSQQ